LIYNKVFTKPPDCSLLIINGTSITHPESIAEHFNKFFCNVGQNNINKIKINDSEFHQLISYEQYVINQNFSCPQATEDEISLIINNLNPSSSIDF
jgi:hypothetical protein